jgi:hypothetical protein
MTVSVWISVGSLIVALLSLTISALALIAAGPRSRVRAYMYAYDDAPDTWIIEVSARNGSRGGTTFDILGLEIRRYNKNGSHAPEYRALDEVDGPALPFRLEGHGFAKWYFTGDGVQARTDWYGMRAWVVSEIGRKTVRAKLKRPPRRWMGRYFYNPEARAKRRNIAP